MSINLIQNSLKGEGMKLIQVFDYSNMPMSLTDKFLENYEPINNSYVRWYPNEIAVDEEDSAYIKEMNEWLVKDGLHMDVYPYFHVLIYVSW